MLKFSLDAGRSMPSKDKVKKLLEILDERLGPL